MFGNPVAAAAVRFVVLAVLQVLVFSRVGAGEAWAPYAQALLYPLTILLLPVATPTVIVLFVAFALGLTIDVPLGTYGVHAGALVSTAFARGAALALTEPREGYAVGASPTRRAYGLQWWAGYAAILFGVHCLAYQALEVFTLVYAGEIFLRAVGSFCVSMLLALAYVLVFDPRA